MLRRSPIFGLSVTVAAFNSGEARWHACKHDGGRSCPVKGFHTAEAFSRVSQGAT